MQAYLTAYVSEKDVLFCLFFRITYLYTGPNFGGNLPALKWYSYVLTENLKNSISERNLEMSRTARFFFDFRSAVFSLRPVKSRKNLPQFFQSRKNCTCNEARRNFT